MKTHSMLLRILLWSAALCGLLACRGGSDRPDMMRRLFAGIGEGEVVAVVGGMELRSDYLLFLYNNLPARVREQMALKDYVDFYVKQKLVFLDTMESDLASNMDLLARMDLAMSDVVMATYLNYGRLEGLTEEQLRKYYEEHRASFVRPERVRVRQIVVTLDKESALFNTQNDDAAGREAALKKIQGLQARLKAGESFEELARRWSEDRSALQGGDIGFIRREDADPAFSAAAFRLDNPGDTSGIVESAFGFHLIQLVEREVSGVMSYDDARDQIRRILAPPLDAASQEARMKERFDELNRKYKAETYPDRYPRP